MTPKQIRAAANSPWPEGVRQRAARGETQGEAHARRAEEDAKTDIQNDGGFWFDHLDFDPADPRETVD